MATPLYLCAAGIVVGAVLLGLGRIPARPPVTGATRFGVPAGALFAVAAVALLFGLPVGVQSWVAMPLLVGILGTLAAGYHVASAALDVRTPAGAGVTARVLGAAAAYRVLVPLSDVFLLALALVAYGSVVLVGLVVTTAVTRGRARDEAGARDDARARAGHGRWTAADLLLLGAVQAGGVFQAWRLGLADGDVDQRPLAYLLRITVIAAAGAALMLWQGRRQARTGAADPVSRP